LTSKFPPPPPLPPFFATKVVFSFQFLIYFSLFGNKEFTSLSFFLLFFLYKEEGIHPLTITQWSSLMIVDVNWDQQERYEMVGREHRMAPYLLRNPFLTCQGIVFRSGGIIIP